MPGIPGVGDAGPAICGDNDSVDTARPGAGRARYAYALCCAVLAVEAVTETLMRRTGVVGLLVLLCLAALASTLPVGLLRPTPAAVAAVVAGALSDSVFHLLTVGGVAAQLLGAYRLGRRGWPPAAVGVGLPYLPLGLAMAGPQRVPAVLLAGLLPTVALAGLALRRRREDAEHTAARQAAEGTLLAHTARGERARIARELHDVVAHHISMVTVQAESARLTVPGMPPAGAQRLSAIGDTARAALTEMRRLLGVLREDIPVGPADRRPQPGLRQLAELLDEAREATGVGTRLILCGSPVALDPGVELAAYRIVQEALTNARRHAPGAAVDVELRFAGADLRLLVRDNGPGSQAAPRDGAHGLLGMRERAAAVGGELRAGAATTGGFLVVATLPTRGLDPA